MELEEKDKRMYNVRINTTIQNLAKNHVEEFPFLYYYEELRKEYDKRNDLKYVQIKILKNIAIFLRN